MTKAESRIISAAQRYASARRHIKEMDQKVVEAARVECASPPGPQIEVSGDRCIDTFFDMAGYDCPGEKRVWFRHPRDWPKYCAPCRTFVEAAHARHIEKRRLGGLMAALMRACEGTENP